MFTEDGSGWVGWVWDGQRWVNTESERGLKGNNEDLFWMIPGDPSEEMGIIGGIGDMNGRR
jgi:hypothetical protein